MIAYSGPLDNFLRDVGDWLDDDAMYWMAQASMPADRSVYDSIPDRMKQKPSSVSVAYEQSFFYLSIGARRALALQAEGKVGPEVAERLFEKIRLLAPQAKQVKDGTNVACEYTGWFCPARGSGGALADTIRALKDSKLPDAELDEMLPILRRNRAGVMIQQAVPWILAFGVGSTVLAHFLKKRS